VQQGAHNATIARHLLEYIKLVDRRLARLLVAKDSGRLDKALNVSLHKLGNKLNDAANLMLAYSGRGFLVRSLLSPYDKSKFDEVEKGLRDVMHVSTPSRLHRWTVWVLWKMWMKGFGLPAAEPTLDSS
jgi:hypothetical protein